MTENQMWSSLAAQQVLTGLKAMKNGVFLYLLNLSGAFVVVTSS